MKSPQEIQKLKKLMPVSVSADGGIGLAFIDWNHPTRAATVVWSWGGGWDHVSVSWPSRCPTWAEMQTVKEMFFKGDEAVIQIHPVESEYVNFHPNCLHLLRPQEEKLPLPPSWMVGPKKGESLKDTITEAEKQLRELGE